MLLENANKIYNKNVNETQYTPLDIEDRKAINYYLATTPYYVGDAKIKDTKFGTNVILYVYTYSYGIKRVTVYYREEYMKPTNPLFLSQLAKSICFEALEENIKMIHSLEKELLK